MPILLLHFKPDELPPGLLDQVRAVAPGVEVVVTDDPKRIAELLDQVEIVAGGGPYAPFVQGKRLRWIQQWGAGADWLERAPEAAQAGFTLTTVSGVHAIPITEHIFAFLLAFARQLPKAFRDQQRHEWNHHGFEDVFELHGKTLLLVGVGAIGEQAAKVGCALGMRVMGVRRHPEQQADCVAEMFASEQLPALLPQADFVVLTVPLTAETRGMIGEREFQVDEALGVHCQHRARRHYRTGGAGTGAARGPDRRSRVRCDRPRAAAAGLAAVGHAQRDPHGALLRPDPAL